MSPDLDGRPTFDELGLAADAQVRACYENNGHVSNDGHARADCPAEPPKPLDATQCLAASEHVVGQGHRPIDCPAYRHPRRGKNH